MVEKFHEELKTLKKDVIVMGNLAKDMLKKSVEALTDYLFSTNWKIWKGYCKTGN